MLILCVPSRFFPYSIYFLKDSEIGELYELVCREHGQELVDKLIADGKATAIEVGNAVFVKIRKLEWSENTNINRSLALGGVSQGAAALGTGVDLDSIASMFDDIITNTGHTELDIGDGRLLRIQQSHRSLCESLPARGGVTHTRVQYMGFQCLCLTVLL